MLYEQFSLVEAQKPAIPPYPFGEGHRLAEDGEALERYRAWWQAKLDQQQLGIPCLDQIRSFAQRSARCLLADSADVNAVYSPINLWRYLGLLTKLTEGNSRARVLDLLGLTADLDPEDDALYRALYWDDGTSVCHPSASLWLNRRTHLSRALLTTLAAQCHTSVFRGPMGEQVLDEAFRAWLNRQTNDLLKDAVSDMGFNRDTAISACTTLYLRCCWSLPFNRDMTHTDVFYARGKAIETAFMRKEDAGGAVYLGTAFSSVIMDLQDGGYVALVLPDPGKSTDEILQSEAFYNFLCAGKAWEDRKDGRVKIAMPRMDILSAMPLRQALGHMGLTDIFGTDRTDFSPDITSEDDLMLPSVEQYARLIMNEDGVEAASIIVADASSLRAASREEIAFTLNRPFLFAVFSENSIPLFTGVFSAP